MTCDRCQGTGWVETPAHEIDACKSCAARAEAEWRLQHPKPARPALRIISTKDRAA